MLVTPDGILYGDPILPVGYVINFVPALLNNTPSIDLYIELDKSTVMEVKLVALKNAP
jgi:hypothetical protein